MAPGENEFDTPGLKNLNKCSPLCPRIKVKEVKIDVGVRMGMNLKKETGIQRRWTRICSSNQNVGKWALRSNVF